MLNFSLRRQDGNVNLSLIVKEMALGIPEMTGGGHKQASGASCRTKDLDKFKALLVELHEKYRVR